LDRTAAADGPTTRQEATWLSGYFGLSMNRIIKIPGVAKSSLYYQARPYPLGREGVRKRLPESVKGQIREVTASKATYGVPRVRAILKRDYGADVSKYMVHRYMKEEGLLLKRFRTRGTNRAHSGKIAVDRPNTRWASDITSIKCWNGQKLRVGFIMDCCDRSTIAWKAGLRMQACDIELLVQEALFARFGAGLPPQKQLQLLHDNGPENREKNLRRSLRSWNLEDCHTHTSESNGMCEGLNGTFKRDYVYENCLDNPQIVISRMQEWVDEYNNFAPHSAASAVRARYENTKRIF
jgi:putative transposase